MYMNDGNGIYERFNIQRPADFTGHSLSVTDVVVLNDGSTVKAYYVDSIGFAELPEFFKERNMDLQKENLLNEELQEIEIFDKPGLFSNGRLRDEEVPEGLYRYDLRGSDYDPGQPITVEKTVVVNHAASVLMAEELDLGADGRLELGEDGLNFTGAELTVREFMEEQQQKRNGLIHGDSDHIAVEGHLGTWYAVDETEIGGEKFFLLEHEEHGDMAACVAVDEQSKLVAEDLWNGFDDEFLDVDKDRLVRFNGFFPKPQSGTYLILDEGGYQVAGQKGTWLVSDEVEVDGQRFVQMRSEQTKNPPPSIILHESGAFVTQTALGFDGEATRKMSAFLQGQKPELLHHQKFFENGTAERAKESGTEQNYNMIDGCVNNVPQKPRRIGGRWSVLDRLHIKQAERRQKDNTPQQEQERSRKS